jgi:hypothetical protein
LMAESAGSFAILRIERRQNFAHLLPHAGQVVRNQELNAFRGSDSDFAAENARKWVSLSLSLPLQVVRLVWNV